MKYVWVLVSPLILAVTGWAGIPVGDAVPLLYPNAAHAAGDPGDAEDGNGSAEPGADSAPTSSTIVTPLGFYWQLTTLQRVLPGTVLLTAGGRHAGSRGTRSDDQFFQISTTGSNDVPEAALRAYHHAEDVMARADPGCRISWTLLAAIGRVESNHGRFGGATLGADGVSRPEIRGPRLDGAGDFAAIRDTDNGTLDRDRVWDRAVGQMQFLPETWHAVARDGDGDGVQNPDDLDDSALGSAVYLCGAGGSLADPAGMARAAFRYNHSDYYVQLVLSFEVGYQTGVFALPSPPPPATARKHVVHAKPRATSHKRPRPASPTAPQAPADPAGKPNPSPSPTPKPKPKPKPKPSPSPAAPPLVRAEGTWTACGAGFCLGSTALDLGPAESWGNRAGADFDGNGTTQSNAEEFAGLVDRQVTLKVVRNSGGLVVYVIGDDGYRNADGSFARAQGLLSPSPTP